MKNLSKEDKTALKKWMVNRARKAKTG